MSIAGGLKTPGLATRSYDSLFSFSCIYFNIICTLNSPSGYRLRGIGSLNLPILTTWRQNYVCRDRLLDVFFSYTYSAQILLLHNIQQFQWMQQLLFILRPGVHIDLRDAHTLHQHLTPAASTRFAWYASVVFWPVAASALHTKNFFHW